MITNTGDRSALAPRLRLGISALTVADLPAWSEGFRPSQAQTYRLAKDAGFEALQTRDVAAAKAAGLAPTGLSRIDHAADARSLARRNRDVGYDCTTLHVGTGFEDDNEAFALIAAIIEASDDTGHPLFVETHRATITQDMKRTLDIVRRFPQVRFNGDFSHWYTGGEMTYGDVAAKIERLKPVTDRTRFIHGRISHPGAIQIPVADGSQTRHVDVFRNFWTNSFRGFLSDAAPGDYFNFYPELLAPSFFYAREVQRGDRRTEEADRWVEALHIAEIARQCWSRAQDDGA